MKFGLFISTTLVAASLCTASMVGATTLTDVYGSDQPDKYLAVYEAGSGTLTVGTSVSVSVRPVSWYPSSPWMTFNPDNSSPSPDGVNPAGTYFYLTAFDLTGFYPSTAIITGRWASDNSGELYLNGVDYFGASNSSLNLTDFTVDHGFVAGINVLSFTVDNAQEGPTGLLVIIDKASANPVPEPSTLLLLGAGIIGVGFLRRKAKK